MKQLTKMLAAFIALGMMFSCEPVEDRDSLPAVTLSPSEINFSVVKDPLNPNRVLMTNLTEGIIPYWNYTNSRGDDLGHSNQHEASVVLPFAGTYTFYFTAYTRGGAVTAVPVPITIDSNYEQYFEEPEWAWLTNGTEGKKWVLNMSSPIGWAGLDFPWDPAGADYWNWYPDYAGNEWVMANRDWGSMTFDLDGNYNVSVTQTALNSNAQTTKVGTFSLNLEGHKLTFNGGPELLFGGDYYPDSSNWVSVNVLSITENSLELAVIRDQSRTGEGVAQIRFHYKPAE